MSVSVIGPAVEEDICLESGAWNNPEEILDQLERVVVSIHFRNSKRYPALLRYLVEETVAGRTDCLKERTLGIEVFGRPADYDTNADPVVRITAGEVRKRIAQYYQTAEHERELRLELPLGSYVPHFRAPHDATHPVSLPLVEPPNAGTTVDPGTPVTLVSSQPELTASLAPPDIGEQIDIARSKSDPSVSGSTLQRPKWPAFFAIGLLGIVAACSIFTSNLLQAYRRDAGWSFFWGPFLQSKEPAMIVLGVHSFDIHGNDVSPISFAQLPPVEQTALSSMIRSNMVPVSDVISYSELVGLLARQPLAFRTQSAAETSIEEFRRGPIILIGGFDNMWTMRLTASLRFRFFADSDSLHEIRDSRHPETRWLFDNAQSALSNATDYAIVARFFDPQIEQHVLVVAGIGKSGTEAAAQFVTDKHALATAVGASPRDKLQNVEIVLATDVIEGKHGPAHVVASYQW